MISLMEVARVNACVGALVGGAAVGVGGGALVGGAAMGVGVEPHAEAITTSVISIIEIGDALIFLPPCGISTGVVRSILALSFVLQTKAHSFFVQMVVTLVYQKPSEEHRVRQNVFDMVY